MQLEQNRERTFRFALLQESLRTGRWEFLSHRRHECQP